jgi:hypothetical protein
LEVFDLPHPAGQWVPSGTNLGHQFQVVDSKRLKSQPTSLIEPPVVGDPNCAAVSRTANFRDRQGHSTAVGDALGSICRRRYGVSTLRGGSRNVVALQRIGKVLLFARAAHSDASARPGKSAESGTLSPRT